ncbi:Gustatory receptor, partial [Aphis craccivora]
RAFINGIIEFDRKITPLLTNLFITHRSWSNKRWNQILITTFAYFIGYKSLHFYLFPKKKQNIVTYILLINPFFTPPFVLHYIIAISSCFFLQNMYARFQMLNDVWECLPAGLVAVSDQWTHNEILRSNAIGFLHIQLYPYDYVCLYYYQQSNLTHLTFYRKYLGNKYFITAIIPNTNCHVLIVFVSWINNKRLKMISYLRLYQISNLHLDIKRQVNDLLFQIKMYMNQISACDSDQISAFGFFDINLNLVTSILTLLISGLITLIQMKNHPFMLKFNNDTINFSHSIP